MRENTIQEKADAFIAQNNLIEILQRYGNTTLVGSYIMKIMTWNDLDVYMDLADFHPDKYYNLIAELVLKLKPVRYDGICNAEKDTYFLGMEIMYKGERWNLDIWWKKREEIEAALAYANDLMLQMNQYPYLREAVCEIKRKLIENKLYGFDKGKKHYHSNEIYEAVFNKGIMSVEDFLKQNTQYFYMGQPPTLST